MLGSASNETQRIANQQVTIALPVRERKPYVCTDASSLAARNSGQGTISIGATLLDVQAPSFALGGSDRQPV